MPIYIYRNGNVLPINIIKQRYPPDKEEFIFFSLSQSILENKNILTLICGYCVHDYSSSRLYSM